MNTPRHDLERHHKMVCPDGYRVGISPDSIMDRAHAAIRIGCGLWQSGAVPYRRNDPLRTWRPKRVRIRPGKCRQPCLFPR